MTETTQRLGALLGPAPDILPPPYDIQRRDALFEEIQRLKATGAAADDIAGAEKELDALLEQPHG